MSSEKNIEQVLKQNCPPGKSGKMEEWLALNERERLAFLFEEVFDFCPVVQVDPPGLEDKVHELARLETQVQNNFTLLRSKAPRIAELASQIEALEKKEFFNDSELRKIVALIKPPLSKSTRASKTWWSPDDYAKTPWICGLAREGQYILYVPASSGHGSAHIFAGSVDLDDREENNRHWVEATQIKVSENFETRRVDPDSLTSLSSTNKVLINLLKEHRGEDTVHTGGYGSYSFAYVPQGLLQQALHELETDEETETQTEE